jgi:predicted MFS family arabinose efflux permease
MGSSSVSSKGSVSRWEPIVQYFRDFSVLKETRSEYWGVQIINFLDCMAYFAMLAIVSVFLSDDLGMSDRHAGWVITLFTSATSIFLFFSGVLTDSFGIRKSMEATMIFQFILRLAIVIVGVAPDVPYRGILAALLLFLMAPFMASVQTVFQSACKRFTTGRSRSAGFNVWYLVMNIGAAGGGFTVDIVRKAMGLSNVHVFSVGVITAALCWVASRMMIRREDQLVADGDHVEAEPAPEKKSPLEVAKAVFAHSAIWKLVVLVACILGVRAVFTYLYLLMPKYWLRTIGPDAAIGTLNAINPIGIVLGLILIIPITHRFKVYNMLVFGALISAFALVPMAIPWEWYGMTIGTTHYVMALLCMVVLTIGEVIWSPKLNEYTAAIAPKGQEGTYLGLSLIPWFLAKTVVSYFSGDLLGRWCPEEVTVEGVAMPLQQAMIEGHLGYWDRPEAMWLVLSAWAVGGCLLAILLKPWMTKGVRER